MSQISQFSKLAVSITVTAAVTLPPRHSHNFLCSSATKSRSLPSFWHWLLWCLFPPIGMCFISCKHLPLADTFMTKARFYQFFLHQTQSKRDGNVGEKVWQTSFTLCPVLDVLVCPVHRLGRWAVWEWASSLLHTNIHRFRFHLIVLAYLVLLRPERTRSGLV